MENVGYILTSIVQSTAKVIAGHEKIPDNIASELRIRHINSDFHIRHINSDLHIRHINSELPSHSSHQQ